MNRLGWDWAELRNLVPRGQWSVASGQICSYRLKLVPSQPQLGLASAWAELSNAAFYLSWFPLTFGFP